MKKRIWFIVLISCLLCGCIRKDRTSDSQLMDSRDVDSTEENENVKKMLQNSGKKVMTFQQMSRKEKKQRMSVK